MQTIKQIKQTLQRLANPEYASQAQRYFKTGPGEYGEGDVFLGIRVPVLRKLARQYSNITLAQLQPLLSSRYHEQRLFCLIILVNQYKIAVPAQQKAIYHFYLRNTLHINNWDLVDISAAHIVGAYLFNKDRQKLHQLIKSRNLWERRIALLACLYFIKRNDFADCLQLITALLDDPHDLIHKASGWMLREIGKQNMAEEQQYLDMYAAVMPRTMLRYALEKLPENLKKRYMAAKAGSAVVKG